MNLKVIGIISIIFFGLACEKVEEQKYQLSDEKWTNLLTDIHISESASQHLSLSLRDSMVKVYLDQILEIHEVSRPIFEEEYERIKKDPPKLRIIYSKVAKRLGELKLNKEERVETKNKIEAKKK